MIVKFNSKKTNDKMGNKAKFLIEMRNNGFNVPNGVVLDSDTYIDVIKENKIDKEINKLLNKINKDNISEISTKIVKLFDSIKLNKDIKEELTKSINIKKKFAVRSSGTKEDLDEYSFAGQYETYLNVSGIEDIEKSIISCYKSMYSETILSYLVNNNICLDNLAMSVVVQEMVDSEYSGICFTIDPISGNDKEMLIEISEGLGENIVSGKTAPEQYRYNWYEHKNNYDKTNKILNRFMLKDMAEVFFNIQLYFGYPCDIEFALENDKLYILQARRITKLKYMGIKDLWSTADFKDGGVSASVCTPYMWSLYEYIWEHSLRSFILESKILKEKDLNRKLGEMYYGRPYWNLSVVKQGMSQVVGYKEREFDSEYGLKMNYEGDGDTTKVSIKSLSKIAKMALAQSKILKTRNKNAEKYKDDLLTQYNNYKYNYDNNKIVDIESTWYTLTHDTYMQSESTYFYQIFINTIHQSLYKDGLLKYVSESDYLSLLANIDNISHLLPFYDMWEVSRHIRSDKKILEYWLNTDINKLVKNIDKNNNLMPEVKEVINNYGYHSDKELDVTYSCYYEDITPIVQSIKDMCDLEDTYSPLNDKERGKELFDKILSEVKEKTSTSKYNKFEDKVKKMRKMLWWREEFRDISTRFYYIIRIYTIEYAKELVKKKVLSDINDIWYLKVGDLWKYIDGEYKKKDLLNIISKNKNYYNAYRNYMSENEIGSTLGGEDKVLDSKIKGLGANNGIVTGRARVIKDFSEIDRLEKDDILVTRFTDTGWTPKFAILSGIVTEYGGILCHAAIVSREYGIPAIVSCHDVMSKINDGDIITIDGSTGIVEVNESDNR